MCVCLCVCVFVCVRACVCVTVSHRLLLRLIIQLKQNTKQLLDVMTNQADELKKLADHVRQADRQGQQQEVQRLVTLFTSMEKLTCNRERLKNKDLKKSLVSMSYVFFLH